MRTETLHPVGDYIAELFNFLGIAEGFEGGLPYFDSANPRRATIGYGFNIEVRDTDVEIKSLLKGIAKKI